MKKIVIQNEKCDFCGTCVGICPADAIELSEYKIEIDPEKCTVCLACVHTCPLGVMKEGS